MICTTKNCKREATHFYVRKDHHTREDMVLVHLKDGIHVCDDHVNFSVSIYWDEVTKDVYLVMKVMTI